MEFRRARDRKAHRTYARLECSPVIGVEIRIAPKQTCKQVLTIGLNALSRSLGLNLFGERELEPLLEVPFEPLLIGRTEWISDSDGYSCPQSPPRHCCL